MRKSVYILTVLMLITILINPTSAGCAGQNREVNQVATDSPNEINIDEALSDYYGVPTAIEDEAAYLNIEGSWYTFEDLTKYPCDCPDIHVPVSSLVGIGFLGIAFVISRKNI